MLKVSKSKGVLGALSLLLLVTLAQPANAGKPGSIPTLNGTLCKSLGGTWKAGKSGLCTISVSTPNIPSFDIGFGDRILITSTGILNNNNVKTIRNIGTIILNSGGTLISNGTIDNYGAVDNSGSFTNLGTFTNRSNGIIVNNPNGIIYNNYQVYNYQNATIENFGIMNNLNDAGTGNSTVLSNSGVFNNKTGAYVNNSGTINNEATGTVNNQVNGTINNAGIVRNYGTIFNNCASIWLGPVPDPQEGTYTPPSNC